ncbi:MAG TPA: hypothetical protein VGK52_10255 [Polyangia bacterium]
MTTSKESGSCPLSELDEIVRYPKKDTNSDGGMKNGCTSDDRTSPDGCGVEFETTCLPTFAAKGTSVARGKRTIDPKTMSAVEIIYFAITQADGKEACHAILHKELTRL